MAKVLAVVAAVVGGAFAALAAVYFGLIPGLTTVAATSTTGGADGATSTGHVAPQLSPFFEELLAHLMDKDPARRPADAAEVAGILESGEESAWWRARSAAIRARAAGAPGPVCAQPNAINVLTTGARTKRIFFMSTLLQ